MTRVIIIDDTRTGYECHKVGCRDINKKHEFYINTSWEEDNLAEAEENFNAELGEGSDYEDPWLWSRDVRIFPCAMG
jgi:hypothetical protein